METVPAKYVRKGRMTSLQLDFDAWDMLREIAPTDKAYGRFISELIRREYVRKQDWQRLRDMQQPAMIDVGGLEDD